MAKPARYYLGAMLGVFWFGAGAAFADLPYRPEFNWTQPPFHESGEALDPATDISEYRLYCDGATTPTVTIPGTQTQYVFGRNAFTAGEHSCHLTSVDLSLEESAASNTVTFTVAADRPVAPVLSLQ